MSAQIHAATLLTSQKKAKPSVGVNLANCLATLRPDLAAQWYQRMNELTPYDVTLGSGYKAYWKCHKHETCDNHIWPAAINARVRGTGCRFCAGYEACECSCFPTTDPELFLEFDQSLNPGIDAYKLPRGTQVSINWKCTKGKCGHHIWPASVVSRASGGNGCPFCSGRKTCPCDSFPNTHPKLFLEFDQNLNPGIDAYQLRHGSQVPITWKCLESKCGHHIWPATLANRTGTNSSGCRFCARIETCPCDSFPNTDPELFLEFDQNLNPGVNAYKLSRCSRTSLIWKCLKAKCDHHRWPSSLNERSQGNGCPFCNGGPSGEVCPCDSLAAKAPILLTEWDFVKNSHLDPYKIALFSAKLAWWICSVCGHNWADKICVRRGNINGCPQCNISAGEKAILLYLKTTSLRYQMEYCVVIDGKSRRFDFLVEIPRQSNPLYLFVEFDGEQHFRYVEHFHGDLNGFERDHQRDLEKDQYCREVGVPLLRIPYYDIGKVPQILAETIANIQAHTFDKLLQPPDDYYRNTTLSLFTEKVE